METTTENQSPSTGFASLHSSEALGGGAGFGTPEYDKSLTEYRQAIVNEVYFVLEDSSQKVPPNLQDKWNGIVSRIHERKDEGSLGLFEIIQDERENLRHELEVAVDSGDQTKIDQIKQDTTKLNSGLRSAIDTLVVNAKEAGVFDSTKEKVEAAEDIYDYEEAQTRVNHIDTSEQDAYATGEAIRLNKTSPDFAGMNKAFVDSAKDWLLLGRLRAESRIAREAGDVQGAIRLDEGADRLQELDLTFNAWGAGKHDFENSAYDWLKGKVDADKARQLENERLEKQSQMLSSERVAASPLEGKRVGAVFMGGVAHTYAVDTRAPRDPVTGERVRFPVYDITKEEDRKRWLEETLYAFRGPKGPSITSGWRNQLNFYRTDDLWSAYATVESNTFRKVKEGTPDYQKAQARMDKLYKEVQGLEEELISNVSYMTMVMCMEDSGGSGTAVQQFLLGGEKSPNLDLVDIIGNELLLQERPDFWVKALGDKDSDVYKAFKQIHKQLGMEVEEAHYVDENGIKVDPKHINLASDTFVATKFKKDKNGNILINLDADKFKKSSIFKNISNGKGVNGWIEAQLMKEEAEAKRQGKILPLRKLRWLNYKKAWDLIISDGEVTRWTETLSRKDEFKNMRLGAKKWSTGWGGDPLMGVALPSNLPRNVKGVYSGSKSYIMDEVDGTYRPPELAESELLVVSYVGCGTKRNARYNDALFQAFGGSRAPLLGDLSSREGMPTMKAIAELWSQIYVGRDGMIMLDNGRMVPKEEVWGMMFSKLIKTKVDAAIINNPGMTLLDIISKMGAPEDMRSLVNGEALTNLLGPNLDGSSGIISDVAGGRTQFKFSRGSMKRMKEAFNELYMNDQNKFKRATANMFNLIGLLFDLGIIFVDTGAKVAGVDVDMRAFGRGGGKR